MRPEKQRGEPLVKASQVTKAFAEVWEKLFSSPVHLDSALSKQAKNLKSILARSLPSILQRPVSQAEALGIGVPEGEPWSLSPSVAAKWRPAALMAERIYEGMANRPVDALPCREDFPPAMIAEWDLHWGPDTVRRLIEILGRDAPLSLRAVHSAGPAEVLRQLKSGSRLPVSAVQSDFAPMGIRLGGYAPVLGTETYKSGLFEIQDEGSQVMAHFALWPKKFASLLKTVPGPVDTSQFKLENAQLDPEPAPWTVVDACAGAGGKSLAIADALKGKGRIFSYDVSERKLQSLRRRATHAGYRNIQAVALDENNETEKLKRFRRTAQVVLVDAPCSGWGVLRRNPDIKWRQTSDVLERMPKIQSRLLSTYSEMVAAGGRLVFGVCTFRPEETTHVVKAFLAAHPDFVAREGGYLGPGPCDGFFMQAFERLKSSDPKSSERTKK
jgi:16S rRNA C967 or C1407 C5-methylase (RsmB/RsmF family)